MEAVDILISSKMKRWPDNVGELLGSMYVFGTLNYLNQVTAIPVEVKWTTYGILAIRGTGCILLKMTLDEAECRVSLIHEGGALSLGSALDFVLNTISCRETCPLPNTYA